MIIACPSCSARYQLADSKIKETGTKVRCPRCSHTFVVHPFREEDDTSDRTELFVRRDELLDHTGPKPEAAEAPKKEAAESVFDQKTMVSSHSPAPSPPENENTAEAAQPKVSPPKKSRVKEDPARIVQPSEMEASLAEGDSTIESMSDSSSSDHLVAQQEIRPFGDATLFEIQRSSKKKSSRPWMTISLILLLCGGAFFAYQIFFSSETIEQPPPKITPQTAKIEVVRPSGWYRDDPRIYQETLANIAALPKSAQEKSENRALLSEALILNGLLSGATDQVNRGLSFTPSLVIHYPNLALSFYGTTAYSVWHNDRMTMSDLYSRWPQENRQDPEFRLLEFYYLAKTGKIKRGLELANKLLSEMPEFQRANDFAYLLILQNSSIAHSIFNQTALERISVLYDEHHHNLMKSMNQVSKLYQEIDHYLHLKAPTKQESKPKEPVAKDVNVPKNNASKKKFISKKTTRKKSLRSTRHSRRHSDRLPKASKSLIAQNKTTAQQQKKARSLYEKGNLLFKKGSSEEALQAYREALKLNPELAEIYKKIGMIYMSQQETERALRAFKIYLQLKPKTEDRQLVEGWISSLE